MFTPPESCSRSTVVPSGICGYHSNRGLKVAASDDPANKLKVADWTDSGCSNL
jgi:hypothetical protein